MAQLKIRKFSPGGVLRTETGDTFTLEEVEQLARENPTNENLRDIVNEMRSGRDVNHSISDNWSSVTSDDFNRGQQRRAGKGPNSFARRWAATFNTDVHQYGEDVNDTTNILASAVREKTPSSTTTTAPVTSSDKMTLITSGGGASFVYNAETGEYEKGDFTNARLMGLLNDLDGYLSDNGTGNYKFRGLGSDVRKVLKDMYAANPNFIKELMDKVQKGKIIEGSPEASILLQLGIGSNTTKAEMDAAVKEKALKDYFVNNGFTEEQFKDFLQYVELDGQGLKLRAGVTGPFFESGKNYYYNDSYNGDFKDVLKGKILYNGRFYNADTLAESGQISDWVKALREHRFTDADQLIKWDWSGTADKYDYQLLPENLYNEFLNNKRYLDVTGQYEKQYDEQGNVYQIMGYYDPNDMNNYTKLGFVDPTKIKYARFDSMGNLVDENYNISLARKAMSPWEHVTTFQERNENGQVVIPSVTTRDGKGILGLDVTFNPEKGTVQFHGGAVQEVLGNNGNAIELDGEIAQILSPEFFYNLQNIDPKDLKKFKDTVLSLVGNKMGNIWARNQLSRKEWRDILLPTYGADAEKYANILFNYFKNYIGRTEWYNKFGQIATGGPGLTGYGLWAPTGQMSRSGRLHEFARSYQQGGLFTGSAAPASSAPKIVQSDRYMPATTEEAGAFQFGEFNDADWFELAGLGADLASVVTGLTGFTPASVATGLAGTASTFMADIRRDGFQMGDLGNLGMGLLFDAASIIPGLGVGASTGKVMKAVKKGLPVLMKLAGVAGIGSAFSLAVNKIQSGEKLTMKDLRIIMNGVLGTYTMAKQGIDITNSRKNAGKNIDVDLKKLHMDDIDASKLSDGQKAALKQYFDPDAANPNKYRDALTDDAQKALYDRFISDGGDETALKFLIGDDKIFVDLKEQRDLVDRVKTAIANGTKISDADQKAYGKLLDDMEIKARWNNDDLNAKRSLDAQNQELADALKVVENPTGKTPTEIADANATIAKYQDKTNYPEYEAFWKEYNAAPTQSRYAELEAKLQATTDEYYAAMFTKKHDSYTAHDEKWAAEIKQKGVDVDKKIADFNKRRQQIEADANEITRLEKVQADYDAKIRALKASGKTDTDTEVVDLNKKFSDGENTIATLKNKYADKRRSLAIDLIDAYRRKEIAATPGKNGYEKATELKRDLKTVNDQFYFDDKAPTRSALEEEFKLLDKDSSEAIYRTERKSLLDRITNDYLSPTGSKKVQRNISTTVDSEFANLSDVEKARVTEILNKDLSNLEADDIADLNYLTVKNSNEVATSGDSAIDAYKTKLQSEQAFTDFKLKEGLGITEVNAFLRKINLPGKTKLRLSEVEWAQVKRSAEPDKALGAILKKKGLDSKTITSILDKVGSYKTVEESKFKWPWAKKEAETNAENLQKMFVLDLDKFKTRYGYDNSIWGTILGRNTKQVRYKDALYRPDATTSLWKAPREAQKAAQRYYQPMLHGMLYNVTRDPIHHTPWYDPKEIYFNEEED